MANVYKLLQGQKNHSIVMPDADLDNAVTNIIGAAFGSAGERCMAASVVVAVGDVADELISRLKQAADEIKIGNGMDEGIFLGPVIRESHKNVRLVISKLAKMRALLSFGMAEMMQRMSKATLLALQSLTTCNLE
ncbi:hypothetical protein GCM10020331_001490 [Ectobacillus funiculus]